MNDCSAVPGLAGLLLPELGLAHLVTPSPLQPTEPHSFARALAAVSPEISALLGASLCSGRKQG